MYKRWWRPPLLPAAATLHLVVLRDSVREQAPTITESISTYTHKCYVSSNELCADTNTCTSDSVFASESTHSFHGLQENTVCRQQEPTYPSFFSFVILNTTFLLSTQCLLPGSYLIPSPALMTLAHSPGFFAVIVLRGHTTAYLQSRAAQFVYSTITLTVSNNREIQWRKNDSNSFLLLTTPPHMHSTICRSRCKLQPV